jgi:hypothetical protein
MNLELSKEDLNLLRVMLEREIGVIRVEIHHCRTHDYTDYLKQAEKQLTSMVGKVKAVLGA